jgi:hypothetical protein
MQCLIADDESSNGDNKLKRTKRRYEKPWRVSYGSVCISFPTNKEYIHSTLFSRSKFHFLSCSCAFLTNITPFSKASSKHGFAPI